MVTKSPEHRFVLVLTHPLILADTGFGVGCPQEAVYKILIVSTPRDGSWGLAPRPIPKRLLDSVMLKCSCCIWSSGFAVLLWTKE